MKIKILYFAQLREASGHNEESLEIENTIRVAQLAGCLLKRPVFDKYRDLPFRYAVNGEFACPEDLIPEDAVFAMLPPVAGG